MKELIGNKQNIPETHPHVVARALSTLWRGVIKADRELRRHVIDIEEDFETTPEMKEEIARNWLTNLGKQVHPATRSRMEANINKIRRETLRLTSTSKS